MPYVLDINTDQYKFKVKSSVFLSIMDDDIVEICDSLWRLQNDSDMTKFNIKRIGASNVFELTVDTGTPGRGWAQTIDITPPNQLYTNIVVTGTWYIVEIDAVRDARARIFLAVNAFSIDEIDYKKAGA